MKALLIRWKWPLLISVVFWLALAVTVKAWFMPMGGAVPPAAGGSCDLQETFWTDDAHNFRLGRYGGQQLFAGCIEVQASYEICAVDIKMKTQAGDVSGHTYTVYIQDYDASDFPDNTTDATSDGVSGSELGAAFAWEYFAFSGTKKSVTSGTTYCFIIGTDHTPNNIDYPEVSRETTVHATGSSGHFDESSLTGWDAGDEIDEDGYMPIRTYATN